MAAPTAAYPLVKQSFRRVRSPFVLFVAGFDESPFMRSRSSIYEVQTTPYHAERGQVLRSTNRTLNIFRCSSYSSIRLTISRAFCQSSGIKTWETRGIACRHLTSCISRVKTASVFSPFRRSPLSLTRPQVGGNRGERLGAWANLKSRAFRQVSSDKGAVVNL